jgi:hypothetical protein
VGFQGAIVRVRLQCLCDPRRLIRAIICELSIAYSNPPHPRLLRTCSVFLALGCETDDSFSRGLVGCLLTLSQLGFDVCISITWLS